MSLLNPTPGELIDRLSILDLKLYFGGAKHFNEEYKEVIAQLTYQLATQVRSDEERYALVMLGGRLGIVNMLLWQATDEHKDFLPEGPKDLERGADLLIRLRKLNKERVRLREEIDKLLGAYAGPEKV